MKKLLMLTIFAILISGFVMQSGITAADQCSEARKLLQQCRENGIECQLPEGCED